MDYKRLGVYSLKKDSAFNGSFLRTHNGYRYEIHEFPIDKRYVLGNGVVMVGRVKFPLKKKFRKILASENFLFVCYDKALEIFDLEGSLARKIESSEEIVCGTGGFLVFDRVDYVLNHLCETVFVTRVPNIMDFTENGMIMSISRLQADEDSTDHRGNLIVQTMHKKVIYDRMGELIVELGDIAAYEGIADIKNVVCCSSIKLETLRSHDCAESTLAPQCQGVQKDVHGRGLFLDCVIVLCKDHVFVMYDHMIIRKRLACQLTHILPERFVVHNYVQEVSIYDCVLMLNCFRTVRLFKSEGIENFLIGLMSSGVAKRLYERFIDGLQANASTIPSNTILCRAYRQLDDNLKEVLDQFIVVDRLDVDELYYLIIYRPDQTERFVQMCKRERRLFYLDDLKSFFEKTNRASELKRIFLRNGILIFEYCGLKKLIEIERDEINAQRACFLSSIQ